MSLQDDARQFAKTLNALNATLKKCADEIDWRTAELYSTEQQLADAMAMINELGFECEQVKKKLAAATTEHDALKAECILAHNQTATALKVVEAHNDLASIEERNKFKILKTHKYTGALDTLDLFVELHRLVSNAQSKAEMIAHLDAAIAATKGEPK